MKNNIKVPGAVFTPTSLIIDKNISKEDYDNIGKILSLACKFSVRKNKRSADEAFDLEKKLIKERRPKWNIKI